MSKSVIISYLPAEIDSGRETVEGKFVQLLVNGCEHLIFASFDLHRYHNQILGHYAETQGIAHRWVNGFTLELDTSKLRVVGGGRFRLDARRLMLFGDSQVYGRFDPDGLGQRITDAGHAWSTLSVEIS